MGKRGLNLNIKLLIVEQSKAHAESFLPRIQEIIPVMSFDFSANIQDALEAHIAKPYDLCLVSQTYPDKEVTIFLKDIQKLYSQERQRFCSFVQFRPVLPENFDQIAVIQMGYVSAISEKLDHQDGERLKSAIEDVAFINQLNEHMADVDWSMKMILKEVDRVSRDRKRGRETKFSKIALDFASDLVEFDPRVLSKYFETMSDQTENKDSPGPSKVKIPANVLTKNLPKLLEERYTGASSRVWSKLLKKYGVPDETP